MYVSQAEISYLVFWSYFLVDQYLVICLLVFSIGILISTTVDSGPSGSAACIFEIIIRYCYLTFSSLSHLRLNLFTWNFCAACLFTNSFPWPLLTPASVNCIAVSYLGISCMECAWMPYPIYQYVVNWLRDFPSEAEQVLLRTSR